MNTTPPIKLSMSFISIHLSANSLLAQNRAELLEKECFLADKDVELERVRKVKIAELKAEQLALVVSKEINDELLAKMKKESDHEDLSDALKASLHLASSANNTRNPVAMATGNRFTGIKYV